jgi:hypothetical protein
MSELPALVNMEGTEIEGLPLLVQPELTETAVEWGMAVLMDPWG